MAISGEHPGEQGAPMTTVGALDAAHDRSFAAALLAQSHIAVVFFDCSLRIVRTNVAEGWPGGPPMPVGRTLTEAFGPRQAAALEGGLLGVLDTGKPLTRYEQPIDAPSTPGRHWTTSVAAFRLEAPDGRPNGIVALFTDTTAQDLEVARRKLRLAVADRIGRSLDVRRTCQDLADILVPAFADVVAINLAEAVLVGEEPPKITGGGDQRLRQAASAAAQERWRAHLVRVGERMPAMPDLSELASLQQGRMLLLSDARDLAERVGQPDVARQLIPPGAHSMMAAPLYARGRVLGNVVVWRIDQDLPFDARDSELLSEITSRAALMIDNARRYTREHRSAAALQQQMLPRAVRNTPAAQTLGSYVPAGGGAGIGGDWFDVIPLPSLRVALVVGDVIGHGLHATATMGRLRAAVRTLADLELAPDELLTRMDDLVQRLAEEADADHRDTIGATCLYAVYDPVSGRCAIASAGHPAPALIRPDGTGGPVGLTPGPILGVGGLPFEITDIPLTPGSLLALYTDGLTERLGADPDDVARLLASAITASAPVEPPPLERLSEALVATAEDPPPRDDVTLLLARTRALPEGAVAVWEYPAEEPVVAQARKAVTRQLSAWGLDELVPETQLIVSELITNAIRYAGGPIQVRLIRESVLVCEVSDPSNTQPRLRRAHITDENGRGLFLIAHMARRWGSRYGVSGKTIWVEQSLPEAADGQDTET